MSLEGVNVHEKRILLEEAIDSGEFFISQLRGKVEVLQSKRDGLKNALKALESEVSGLRVKHSKLSGLSISQEMRMKQEIDQLRMMNQSAEDSLWASLMEKKAKCKKLEQERKP